MTDVYFPCTVCGKKEAKASRMIVGIDENGKLYNDFECSNCGSIKRAKIQSPISQRPAMINEPQLNPRKF